MPRIAMLSTAHIHTESFMQHLQDKVGGAAVIWDDNRARGEDYAQRFDVPFQPDLEAVINDASIDGMVLVVENTRHLELLRAAIPAGKPIMCEKPLTTTSADAAEVLALVEQHGTPITTGYFMPWSGEMRAAAKAISAGELGTITHVSHTNAHQGGYRRIFDKPALAWFAEPSLSGGGALLDLGTHSVHLLRHMFGPVRQVWAEVSNRSGNYPTVDDHGIIHLRFASGVLGSVEAAWIHPAGPQGLRCYGDAGAMWQPERDQLVIGMGRQEPRRLATNDAAPERIDRLLAMIAGDITDEDWRADLTAAADSVAIVEAAYASARSGQWQTL